MRPLRILSASLIAAALDAASVPDGFVFETVVTGLDPAGMTIAPDGRVFILDKKGLVRVVRDGVLQSQPYLDITARVDNANERGLLGMAFDPDFATNARFYIYYTVKGSPARNRIARFAAASASASLFLPSIAASAGRPIASSSAASSISARALSSLWAFLNSAFTAAECSASSSAS